MGHSGTIVVLALMAVTAIVLVIGLLLMARGGEANRKYSNKLMVLRVVFQGLAIAAIAILMLLKVKA